MDDATPPLPAVRSARSAARRLVPAAFLLALLTQGCASTGGIKPDARTPAVEEVADAPAAASPAPVDLPSEERVSDDHREALLRAEVRRWEGTPHVLGGTGRSGLDCSAFVQNVLGDVFDVRLPRTTETQAEAGEPVRDALQAGDLVFFTPSRKSRHVGIYLSGGEFAHVSSSRGVMISHLDERYWADAYWTSRRVLDALPAAEPKARIATGPNASAPRSEEPVRVRAEAPPPRPEPASDPPRRIGW